MRVIDKLGDDAIVPQSRMSSSIPLEPFRKIKFSGSAWSHGERRNLSAGLQIINTSGKIGKVTQNSERPRT
jgi:hypothetical protein